MKSPMQFKGKRQAKIVLELLKHKLQRCNLPKQDMLESVSRVCACIDTEKQLAYIVQHLPFTVTHV